MVARRGKRVGHSDVNRLAVVMNLIRLAMHQSARALHDAARNLPDALMSQTHSQQRNPGPEMADDVIADPRLVSARRGIPRDLRYGGPRCYGS